ncbi:MAG TPA: heat-inducible transcription repressor HrcA [Clostridium sp.]|nr:heat-inducible transcription repressor HrcA [Clostridium sp.]
MFLDDRKKSILHAIIDDYINTAEPVGSRTLARKHGLGLSSATIRNEMADLEDMGYLTQPHTSAGRIPSDKGYRFYVDQLMEFSELTDEEMYSIKDAMETRINELSQFLKQASVIMSQITKYASMAAAPGKQNSILKTVQIVPVEKGKALIVVLTNAGVIKNSLINIPETVLPEELITVSNIFNEKLKDLTIDNINASVIKEIELLLGNVRGILLPILNGVTNCINQIDCPEIYLDGTINMLNYPEFSDVMRAKEFLNLMDAKDVWRRILNNVYKDGDYITITIGEENKIVEMKDCSLITTTYNLGNVVVGTIGVIGPTRMEYSKVLAAMDYMRKKANEEIRKLIGENEKNI